MSDTTGGRKHSLKDVPTWWPVLAGAVGLIAVSAQAYAKISEHDQRLSDLEAAQPAIARELRDVNVGIARLEGKIDTINEREKAAR